MKTPFNLGRKSDFVNSPISLGEKGEDVHYPEFHYSGDKELELPDEGTMEIKFKVVAESEEKRNGKEHYSCTIQVCSIEEVEEDEVKTPAKSDRTTEEAIDALAKAIGVHPESHEEDPEEEFKTTSTDTPTDKALDALAKALHAHELADKDADDEDED